MRQEIMDTNEAFAVKKKYKLVPPDGGYGYFILVAASINLISTSMFYVCFGVIYNDFFIEQGMGSTSISLLAGVRALSLSLSGFMTGPLLKLMSRRQLSIIGSICFNSGVFGAVFVQTEAQFFVCQGFLQTFGMGFLYNVSSTVINDYFVDKKLLSTSLVNTFASAAGMVAPKVVSWSMAEYGFRGTLIVVSAVGVQTFVGSMLLQPVAWHLKKVEVAAEKMVLLQSNKGNIVSQTTDVKLDNLVTAGNGDIGKTALSAESFIASTKRFLDWPLFKRYVRTSAACLGVPVVVFADILFVYNLAPALYACDWDNAQVSWSFTLVALGDLATRIFFIFASTWLRKLGNHLIYLIGLLIAVATRLAMLWVSDYTWNLGILTVLGVSRCIIIMVYPLVVSDCVTPEEFPSAIGQSMMLYGLCGIVLGPSIGAIRDTTDSYTVLFVIIIVLLSGVTVAWSIEMLQKFRKIQGNKVI